VGGVGGFGVGFAPPGGGGVWGGGGGLVGGPAQASFLFLAPTGQVEEAVASETALPWLSGFRVLSALLPEIALILPF